MTELGEMGWSDLPRSYLPPPAQQINFNTGRGERAKWSGGGWGEAMINSIPQIGKSFLCLISRKFHKLILI